MCLLWRFAAFVWLRFLLLSCVCQTISLAYCFLFSQEDFSSPLHVACINSHYDMAKLLLSNGACIQAEDADGMTPILRFTNPWSPSINMHILLICLRIFPRVQVEKICLNIRTLSLMIITFILMTFCLLMWCNCWKKLRCW